MNKKPLPPQGRAMGKMVLINFLFIILALMVFARALKRSNSIPKNAAETFQEQSQEKYKEAVSTLESQVLSACRKSINPIEPDLSVNLKTEVWRWRCNDEVIVVLLNKDQIQFIFTKGGTVVVPYRENGFIQKMLGIWKENPSYLNQGYGVLTPPKIQAVLDEHDQRKMFDDFPKDGDSPVKSIEYQK